MCCSWTSYNIPFFADIARESGVAAECLHDKECDAHACQSSTHSSHVTHHTSHITLCCRYCHDDCARAKIFAREMPSHDISLGRMQNIMRLNNWRHDPFSGGDPGDQLSGA